MSMKYLKSTLVQCLILSVIVLYPAFRIEAQRIDTQGVIQHVVLNAKGLQVNGNFATFSNMPAIDTIKVSYLDKEYFIALDYPQNELTFDYTIPLNQSDRKALRDVLISMTPLSNGVEGYPIYYLVNSSLPMPLQSEVDLVGGGSCMANACEFLGHFIGRAGLKEADTVLDVGCGVGRIAYSLAYYLNESATYRGFDIIPALISRAQDSISPSFSNFQFELVDIYNKLYNPAGVLSATTFTFPYPDNHFDFVFLTSVFTHLTYQDYAHYLKEIHRVLKPGGKCFGTMFLIDEESKELILEGKSTLPIRYPLDNCFTMHLQVPEAAIGYLKTDVLTWLGEMGFKIDNIYPGSWCGRTKNYLSYQDILIFTKE